MRRTLAKSRPVETKRIGAAIVELAMCLPVMMVLATGIVELGFQGRTANTMYSAVREAGRISSMNTSGEVEAALTLNQKVVQDIKNYLTANGLSGNLANVSITSEETSDFEQPFDLEDPNNDHRMFRIAVQMPYAETQFLMNLVLPDSITASIVFQHAGQTIAQ